MIDCLKRCLSNLERKRLRSVLTILSIAIGVASVVLVGTVGEIGKNAITSEIESLGVGSLTISVDNSISQNAHLEGSQLQEIQMVHGVESVMPIMMEYTKTSMCGLVGSSVVWGVDAGAQQVISLSPVYGRLITPQDVAENAKVCVVDENMAMAYYKRVNIVGKQVMIDFPGGPEGFTVVGVVASGGNIMQNMLSGYVPCFVYLPYTTVQQYTGRSNLDRVAVKIGKEWDVEQVGEVITRQLAQQTDSRQESFHAENMFSQKEKLDNILTIITIILSCIAGISLLVAGLGIMTVMLVSIHERTREIGIKKAIGAKRISILGEFLLESMCISLFGCVLGVSLGLAVVGVGCWLMGLEFLLNQQLMLVSVGISAGVGIGFGAYPAYLASNMRPVDALRFE